MTKQDNPTRVPRLRFPEFRDLGEWNASLLGDVADFVDERVALAVVSTANFVSTENLLPDYGGVVLASKLPTISSVGRYRAGDVLVSNIRPYLKKVWHADRDGGASHDVIVLRAKGALLRGFLASALRSDGFLSHVMLGARGLKMPRGDVAFMRQYLISHPNAIEQQKISDVLASLDEVIAGHSRKIEALRAFRIGLMRQMFPRDGETVPLLRFPEFQSAPRWKEVKAGVLFANRTERGDESLSVYSVTTKGGLVKRDTLGRCIGNLAQAEGNKKALRHDIVYNMMRMWQGACGVASEECMVSPAYVVLSPQSGVHSPFYGYLFKTPQMLRMFTARSRGLTEDRLRLYFQDFSDIALAQPAVREQRRIAGCLRVLDKRIATESSKVDALKVHRKGLMQQLFPVATEA